MSMPTTQTAVNAAETILKAVVHKVPRIGGKGEARQSTRVALELR